MNSQPDGSDPLETPRNGLTEVSQADPHTQIAAGLEQLVILTRVTFGFRDAASSAGLCCPVAVLHLGQFR
jgi:hypothetical protein